MKIAATASGKNSSKPMLKSDLGGTVNVLGRATYTYNVDSDTRDVQSTFAIKLVLTRISADAAKAGLDLFRKVRPRIGQTDGVGLPRSLHT